DSVNLARVLNDGEQIHIPEEGEDTGTDAQNPGTDAQNPGGTGEAGTNGTGGSDSAASGTAAGGNGAGQGAAGESGKVDLNTADATALQTLPGVGPVPAEAIISHRQTQHFAAVDDLLLVRGIGPRHFESVKDLVTVGCGRVRATAAMVSRALADPSMVCARVGLGHGEGSAVAGIGASARLRRRPVDDRAHRTGSLGPGLCPRARRPRIRAADSSP